METQLTLTSHERRFLSTLLATILKEALAEEQDAEARPSRKHVRENEDILVGLLTKLVGPQEVVESFQTQT